MPHPFVSVARRRYMYMYMYEGRGVEGRRTQQGAWKKIRFKCKCLRRRRWPYDRAQDAEWINGCSGCSKITKHRNVSGFGFRASASASARSRCSKRRGVQTTWRCSPTSSIRPICRRSRTPWAMCSRSTPRLCSRRRRPGGTPRGTPGCGQHQQRAVQRARSGALAYSARPETAARSRGYVACF